MNLNLFDALVFMNLAQLELLRRAPIERIIRAKCILDVNEGDPFGGLLECDLLPTTQEVADDIRLKALIYECIKPLACASTVDPVPVERKYEECQPRKGKNFAHLCLTCYLSRIGRSSPAKGVKIGQLVRTGSEMPHRAPSGRTRRLRRVSPGASKLTCSILRLVTAAARAMG